MQSEAVIPQIDWIFASKLHFWTFSGFFEKGGGPVWYVLRVPSGFLTRIFFKAPLLGHGVASGGFLRSSFCHPKVFFDIILHFFGIFCRILSMFPQVGPK